MATSNSTTDIYVELEENDMNVDVTAPVEQTTQTVGQSDDVQLSYDSLASTGDPITWLLLLVATVACVTCSFMLTAKRLQDAPAIARKAGLVVIGIVVSLVLVIAVGSCTSKAFAMPEIPVDEQYSITAPTSLVATLDPVTGKVTIPTSTITNSSAKAKVSVTPTVNKIAGPTLATYAFQLNNAPLTSSSFELNAGSFARVGATTTLSGADAVSVLNQKFAEFIYTFNQVQLTGTLSVTGATDIGSTMTASLTGSNATNITYKWYRNGSTLVKTGNTYTITAQDAGSTLKVEVSDSSGVFGGVKSKDIENVPLKAYAMFYSDGSLVFQRGNTPESGKTLTQSWTGFEDSTSNDDDVRRPWHAVISDLTNVSIKAKLKLPRNCNKLFDSAKKLTSISGMELLDTSNVTDMSWMFRNCVVLSSLDVSNFDTSNVTNMNSMFSGCVKIVDIDVSKFDTSNVTDMDGMFFSCLALLNLDLSSFDTSNVTDMNGMFASCENLTSLDVSRFDTFNVIDMNGMFRRCVALPTLDVSNFDTSNVTGMASMFSYCKSLTNFDISNFDTFKVTDMTNMFSGCESLLTLNISNFNTVNVTRAESMFNYCLSLSTLDISKFDTSNMTDMSSMFANCSSLTTIDVSKFNTSKVTDMAYMFGDCDNVTTLDLSNFDTSNVTNMYAMFQGNDNLTTLNVLNFNTSSVTDMTYMFRLCLNLQHLDISSFDFRRVENVQGFVSNTSKLKSVTVGSGFMPTSLATYQNITLSRTDTSTADTYWYDFTGKLYRASEIPAGVKATYYTSVPDPAYAMVYSDGSLVFQRGNTPEVGKTLAGSYTGFEDSASDDDAIRRPWAGTSGVGIKSITVKDPVVAPRNCQKLFSHSGVTSITGLELFDTSKVTNMRSMFSGCRALKSLDLSGFDTSKVTTMYAMFEQCYALTNLDVSSFDTSNVTTTSWMFTYCESLTSIDVSNFDTSKVTDMYNMFGSCSALTSVDVSNFDTSQVMYMDSLFAYCSSLTNVDLSSFDTSKVTWMTYMFVDCASLESVDISMLNLTSLENVQSMFQNCSKIQHLDVRAINFSALDRAKGFVSGMTSLKSITVSSNFAPVTTVLPNFKEVALNFGDPLVDSTWYDASGKSYLASAIPAGVAATYYTSLDAIPAQMSLMSLNDTDSVDQQSAVDESTLFNASTSEKTDTPNDNSNNIESSNTLSNSAPPNDASSNDTSANDTSSNDLSTGITEQSKTDTSQPSFNLSSKNDVAQSESSQNGSSSNNQSQEEISDSVAPKSTLGDNVPEDSSKAAA